MYVLCVVRVSLLPSIYECIILLQVYIAEVSTTNSILFHVVDCIHVKWLRLESHLGSRIYFGCTLSSQHPYRTKPSIVCVVCACRYFQCHLISNRKPFYTWKQIITFRICIFTQPRNKHVFLVCMAVDPMSVCLWLLFLYLPFAFSLLLDRCTLKQAGYFQHILGFPLYWPHPFSDRFRLFSVENNFLSKP